MYNPTALLLIQMNNCVVKMCLQVQAIIPYVRLSFSGLTIIMMHIVRDTAVKRPNGEAKFSTRSTLKQFTVT